MVYGDAGHDGIDTYWDRLSVRMQGCAGLLLFAWKAADDNGETRLKLKQAHFCRVRHCPVCQWRRTLLWLARFHQAYPAIAAKYPKARWVFLTLTVRNCPIDELGETMTAMGNAWHRLLKRKEMHHALGWIRTTEVTRGADGSAHPHYHALMMVRPSWFAKGYVTHARWKEAWQECLRVDYQPWVDIRSVKARVRMPGEGLDEGVLVAAREVLKYSTKPADMVADGAWLLELTRQTHKRRFIASGGELKDVLKVAQESDQDMVSQDEPGEAEADDGTRLAFGWAKDARKYRRAPKNDI